MKITQEDIINLIKKEWLTVVLLILMYFIVIYFQQQVYDCNVYYQNYMLDNCTEYAKGVYDSFTVNVSNIMVN